MAGPRLFVSYSWSSPDHETRVLRLATDLRESGVDVILDKWDPREGHDAHAFMEKMVTDPEIKKVVLVCDKAYVEKTDERTGGVGTEAQIISPEIYEKQDQDKFVAIVTERDEHGKLYLPVYYRSRIYIDMSDPSTVAENFEKLLRWVHGQPLHKKPALERVRHRQNQKGDSQGSQKVIQAMSWVKGGQPWMTRPYSEDLRERVVRVVESGTSRNAAAKQFEVSISFVVKLMQRWKQRGTIKADKYGGWKKSKLAPHGDRIRALVMENCDITIDELCVLLAAEGIEAKRSTLGDFLLAQGLSRKKRQPTPPSRSALTSRRREPLGATSNLG